MRLRMVHVLATRIIALYLLVQLVTLQLFNDPSPDAYGEDIITSYPLYVPNFRDFVQGLLRGDLVDPNVKPINENYRQMKLSKLSAPACAHGLDMLILIKSAAHYRNDRFQLRKMWANHKFLSAFPVTIRYVFLLGTAQLQGFDEEFTREIRDHGDLILLDFVDSYRNNTYKIAGGLRWAAEHCSQAKFVTIVDDDVFLFVESLLQLIREPWEFGLKLDKSVQAEDYFYAGRLGHFGGEEFPRMFRNSSFRHHLSEKDYPPKHFPLYSFGMTTIFTRRTVREIWTAMRFVKHLWIDDLYVGLVAHKLGIPFSDLGTIINTGIPENRSALIDYCGDRKSRSISLHYSRWYSKRLSCWRNSLKLRDMSWE